MFKQEAIRFSLAANLEDSTMRISIHGPFWFSAKNPEDDVEKMDFKKALELMK